MSDDYQRIEHHRPGAGRRHRGCGNRPSQRHAAHARDHCGDLARRAATESAIIEPEVRDALLGFNALWNKLFPAEQARIVKLLVERVDVRAGGISIPLCTEGLASMVADLWVREVPESRRGTASRRAAA